VRFGVIISSIGMAVAVFMVRPTPEQAGAVASGYSTIVGAHTVGVPDGGPGLPVFGWSTVGGDLRVAHFVGLHALQTLPLFGWLFTRQRALGPLTANDRLALVWTSGLSYLGLVVLLAWQALRGESVVHPGPETLATAAVLAASAATSIIIVVARAWMRSRRLPVPAAAIEILSHQEDRS
jgi:hypothetical protein